MAVKRMFSMKVVDNECFLSLPLTAQALYYALCMRADDDGLLDNAMRLTTRYIQTDENDLAILFEREYLLDLGRGVTAIRHWHVHNTIRGDRYSPTMFQKEFANLQILEDGTYALVENVSPNRETSGCRLAAADKESKEKPSQKRGCGGEETYAEENAYDGIPVGEASGREGCFPTVGDVRPSEQKRALLSRNACSRLYHTVPRKIQPREKLRFCRL